MTAEIITIGDEILIGQTVDTNSTFIAKEFNKIGLSINRISSIKDAEVDILNTLQRSVNCSDIVIVTGGLGPTNDDITKNTLLKFFNDKLITDRNVLDNIKFLWKKYIKQPLLQVNIDQSLVPSKAHVFINNNGSAPGLWMTKDKTTFIFLPGVPFEMKALIKHSVIPKILKEFSLPHILHKTILTYGMGESSIAEKIKEWEDNLPVDISFAYLPSLGRVKLRLSTKGVDLSKITANIQFQIDKLIPLIKDVFVGYEEDESIQKLISNRLIKNNSTISLAESFTGGKIADSLVSIIGASTFFKGSLVCYSTESKKNILKIDEDIIKKHTVVSSQVVESMAIKVKEMFSSDYGLATTGNAGPDKGDSDKEIGTVYIGIATPKEVYSFEFNFGNSRERVTQKSVNKSFELLLKELLKN
ncbi:MAG: nicotinamide-nucleotide amidase [Flavobacteriaceae bacterium]|jgi:nicotinamide-nucleotide amidase|tara:strand:+ start:95 stop:1342 length:1248 start_codon:yes stop_codon:yes gene_type:complete